jgi:hypothetical protein
MMSLELILFVCFTTLLVKGFHHSGNNKYVYKVTKVSRPININAVWNKYPWKNIPVLNVNNPVGAKTGYKLPKVQAKVAYGKKRIYVIFRVKYRYIRCLKNKYQSSVYNDSCVEFYFTPGPNISKGYFNLEMNCIGSALFKFHNIIQKKVTEVSKIDFSKIKVAHSIHSVDTGSNDKSSTSFVWLIEYSIPFSILTNYTSITYPKQGVKWKANFYKIANKSSHPHWLSWSKMDISSHDFHRPIFFGTLIFE